MKRWQRMRACGIILVLFTLIMTGMMAAPTCAAIYNFPYPSAENKKGLMAGDGMVEDVLELNINHATFNFPITHMIAYKSERNSSSSYSIKYKGKRYWFRKEHPDVVAAEEAKKEEGIRAETIDESRKKAGQELLHAEKTRQQGSVA